MNKKRKMKDNQNVNDRRKSRIREMCFPALFLSMGWFLIMSIWTNHVFQPQAKSSKGQIEYQQKISEQQYYKRAFSCAVVKEDTQQAFDCKL